MYLRSRSLQRTVLRTVLLALILFSTLEVLHVRRYVAVAREAAREQELAYRQQQGVFPAPGRVFITGIFWNNEGILRETIVPALLELSAYLGKENVFISLHESGSWDRTKTVLGELDAELEKRHVERRISTSNTSHEDVLAAPDKSSGWITPPGGTQKEFRRIPFLARERNIALEPLAELAAKGQAFDKVLFINDVVFSAYDALTLLSTNRGAYAAACAMDFKDPPSFYDTFALRDLNGEEHLMPTWPYFRAAASRTAAIWGVPVPVRSCWNGMVAMTASPFTTPSPLLFRGLPDSLAQFHLEASECCLVHADNPLSATHGVFVNPQVRVAYSKVTYDAAREGEAGLSAVGISARLWENRIRRWSSTTKIKRKMVERRMGKWEKEKEGEGREEAGGFCVINEMQVLRGKGWAHV